MQNDKFIHITYPIVNVLSLYDYYHMQEDIVRLQMLYPFLQVECIGKSVQGRDISHIRLGKGKKKIHINASFHANEWLTTSIVMMFINEYCLAMAGNQRLGDVHARDLFEDSMFSIVPMVNPDGVQLVLHGPNEDERDSMEEMNKEKYDYTWWKANINGVDLNNQFPAKWDVERKRKYAKTPAPRDYPGQFPLSEPESIVIANLVRQEKFDIVLALHSQGREIYFGYEGFEPEISVALALQMEKVSGYKAIRYIDSHAGFRDWFIQEYKKPGFTIEVGKGVNPLPLSSLNENYQDVKKIILSVCN